MIKENLDRVKANIRTACERAGRSKEEVLLIAVSKTKPVELLQEAYDCGVRDFGENKVQEILDKYDKLPSDINWHMIGHLQTNKVKYIIDKVCMIHSVDSLHLAEEISRQAVKAGTDMDILVEVNMAEEESKFGINPENAGEVILQMSSLPSINIKGLMTVAPFTEDAESNRVYFRQMKKLIVDIISYLSDNGIDDVLLSKLSMGMTGDYMVAIEEGASFVRVGTGIFGARDYQR